MRLAADENFKAQIVTGLRRRNPWLDIVRVQDAGLEGADDPTVQVIEDLLLLIEASKEGEWEGQVLYIPL